MLYIFHVEECRMLTCDMQVSLKRVHELKEIITKQVNIPPEKQVLLISGGCGLQDDECVGNYSGGTDTNPIFLFETRSSNELSTYYRSANSKLESEESKLKSIENVLKERVEEARKRAPCKATVYYNTNLAQEICCLTIEHLNASKELVLYQHLQQQGWGAVVANLEDLILTITKKSDSFIRNMDDLLLIRDEKLRIVENIDKDLELLRRIPMLPELRMHRKKIREGVYFNLTENNSTKSMETSAQSDAEESDAESDEDSNKLMYLDEWMNIGQDIEQLKNIRICLEQLNKDTYEFARTLSEQIRNENKTNGHMKEIDGLGDRLSQLDTLLRDGKGYANDQKILSQSFVISAKNSDEVNDVSIYPSLCDSHFQNLHKMIAYLTKILEIKSKCFKAKYELTNTIVHRLMWIMHIQSQIHKLDQHVYLWNNYLTFTRTNLKIVTHVHKTPQLYFMAVSEVMRRREFCKKYVEWTSLLSSEAKEICEKESKIRKNFISQYTSHVLLTLFPGLRPGSFPHFATEKPEPFDQNLPQFSQANLDLLRRMVPELSHLLNVEEPLAVPSIVEAGLRINENVNTLTPSCYGKDGTSGELFTSAVTSSLKGSITHPALERTYVRENSQKEHSSSRPSSLVRDQPESETDTEEFEKVCGSISDGTYSPTEGGTETKSLKTKHSFSSQPSDSKHIKLDSSHHLDVPSEMRVQRDQECTTHKRSTSSSECVLSPTSQLSPEEFISPDFYIDESMPSSYTESNCTTTTTGTSSSGDAAAARHLRHHHSHHHHYPHLHSQKTNITSGQIRSHRIPSSELLKQIDEKSITVAKLQNELESSRSQVETLQSRLNALSTFSYKSVLKDLRQEMESLKDKVRDDETSYINYFSEVSARIVEILEKIQKETEANQQLAVQSALTLAQMEEDERRNTLQAQLTDTSKELEIYQVQTRDYITEIDRLKGWIKDERSQLIAENEETVKKLTLEHEIEMDNLREKWEEETNQKIKEIESLKEDVRKVTERLQKTEDEKESLHKSVEAKFEQTYKKKEENVRQILGDAYMEHEKKSLEFQKEEMENSFKKEKLKLEEVHQNDIEYKLKELQQSLEIEAQKRLAEEQEEAEKRHAEELQRCRDLWEAQKEEEVENKMEELKAQLKVNYDQSLENAKLEYKTNLDTLRSRFRMMTTANMDKSPSETSLEKFERGDFVETVYHDVMLTKLRDELREEKERALKELGESLEARHSLALQQEKEKFEEKRKEELRRLETEKEEVFKEISMDKERVIEDLRLRVEFMTDEIEKLRKICSKTQEEGLVAFGLNPSVDEWQKQCAIYKKEIERLEKEVQRAKRLSFISEKHPDLFTEDSSQGNLSQGSTDIQNVESTNIQKLQQENRELRNALARTNSDRKRVSLDDAQPHDIVLVVWDDMYSQYRILLEHQSTLHFLHSDSYTALGLSKGTEKPDKLYCTAQVTKKKEFCQAKRDGNRFRVPKGTKFYRVEAGPHHFPKSTSSSAESQHKMGARELAERRSSLQGSISERDDEAAVGGSDRGRSEGAGAAERDDPSSVSST